MAETIHEGWGTKVGAIFKTWKRRWFVLNSERMSYYTEKNGVQKGEFSVQGVTFGPDSECKKPNAIAVKCPHRTYVISYDTAEIRDQWLEALEKATKREDKPDPVPEPDPVPTKPEPTKPREPFKLLLCGTGESGKTTYVKQLKLNFLGGIGNKDRSSTLEVIRGNLIETMQRLISHANDREYEISEDLEEDVEGIQKLDSTNTVYNAEISKMLSNLWEDPGIQSAFEERDETDIPDHMDYFFEKLDLLEDDDYVCTDEDVVKARVRSVGIDEVSLNLNDVPVVIYDVGGQKNERSKWEKVEHINGVIFVISLADFDKPMFEYIPNKVARVGDALEVFNDISHRKLFCDKPIFLIANKVDSFKTKVETTDCFTKQFPEYEGDPHDFEECYKYIVDRFIQQAMPEVAARPIVQYRQSALDKDQVCENTSQISMYIKEHY